MIRKILSLLLCLLLLLPTLCMAGSYTITEQELKTLQTNSIEQENTIIKLLNVVDILMLNSNEANLELLKAKEELMQVLEDLRKSKQEVLLLEKDLKNSNEAIEKANLLLKEYEKEVKRKTRILKVQRNIAYFIAGSVMVFAASK